jgi:hypothetical protein
MLRTNLSTRPFYNERAVHVGLLVAALLVVALTAFNITRILALSSQSTELAAQVAREHEEADRLTQQAADIRRTINREELALVAEAAGEANALIDQRTFSWTAFFNEIETTLPPDVMLTSVRPTVRDGFTRVAMAVLARRAEDLDEFIEKMEANGAFEDLLSVRQDKTESGLYRATIEGIYTGAFEEAPPETADAPAATPDTPVTAPETPEDSPVAAPRRGQPPPEPSTKPKLPAGKKPRGGGDQ